MGVSSPPTAMNNQTTPVTSDVDFISFGKFKFSTDGLIQSGAAATTTSRLNITAPPSGSKPTLVFPAPKHDAAAVAGTSRIDPNAPSSGSKPDVVFSTLKQGVAAASSSSSSGSRPKVVVFPALKQDAAAVAGTSRIDTNASSSGSKPDVVFPTLKQGVAAALSSSSLGSKPNVVFPTLKQVAAAVAGTSRIDTNASSSGSKPGVVFPALKQDDAAATTTANAWSSVSKPNVVFPTLKQDVAAASASSSSGSKPNVVFPTLKQDDAAAVDAESKKIKNQRPASQELPSGNGKAKFLPGNSIYGRSRIWSDYGSTTAGESPVLDVQANTMEPLEDKSLCLKKDVSHVASTSAPSKTLSTQSTSSYFNQLATVKNPAFLYEYGAIIVQDPQPWQIEYYKALNSCYDIENFVPMGTNYPTTLNHRMWNHEEPELRIDVPSFERILILGSYEQKEKVLSILKGSIIMLMIDRREHMQRLFYTLVSACEGRMLNALAEDVLSNEEHFLHAVICETAQQSIFRLVEKLRKTTYAYRLTRILSNKFVHVMTNRCGGMVVEKCLMLLGYEANKVLYEKAIVHYGSLATHKLGCRALNHCINYVAGEQRTQLLNLIADVSPSLSFDPYGNYVVQNVLLQLNEEVNTKILGLLQKHFLELSHLQAGSHVVETCMKTSDLGLVSVVEIILVHPETAFRLAQGHFGNYVIQNALKMTLGRGFSGLYNTLVACLLPYAKPLLRSKQGKSVLSILNEGIHIKGRVQ